MNMKHVMISACGAVLAFGVSPVAADVLSPTDAGHVELRKTAVPGPMGGPWSLTESLLVGPALTASVVYEIETVFGPIPDEKRLVLVFDLQGLGPQIDSAVLTLPVTQFDPAGQTPVTTTRLESFASDSMVDTSDFDASGDFVYSHTVNALNFDPAPTEFVVDVQSVLQQARTAGESYLSFRIDMSGAVGVPGDSVGISIGDPTLTVSHIPEPATAILLGLATLTLLRRRR